METKQNGVWKTVCESDNTKPNEKKVTGAQITKNLLGLGHFQACIVVPYSNRAAYMGPIETPIARVVNARQAPRWTFVENEGVCDHTEDIVTTCTPLSSRWGKRSHAIFAQEDPFLFRKNVKYEFSAYAFATVSPIFTNTNKKILSLGSKSGSKISYWMKTGKFANNIDGALDDFKIFREGMTAQQILNEMNALKSTEELESEKLDHERAGVQKKEVDGKEEDQESNNNKKIQNIKQHASTMLMAYSFEGSMASGVGDDSENDLLAQPTGKLSLARIVHPSASHVWKSCPGANPLRPEICGGYDKIHSRTRGYCDLSENPPKCHCSKHYRGPSCLKTCPTHPKMGVCSGHGICHWVQPIDAKNGAVSVVGVYPKPGDPSWCECKKAQNDGVRFIGEFCEHECPASQEKTCSGHGICQLTSKGEGQTSASCTCQVGWFGVGCEMTCAGALDDAKELPVIAASLPLKGTCSGHGKCTYSANKDHQRCGKNPHRCGPGFKKTCVCDHHGGWDHYAFAGGTCLQSCPGAHMKPNEFLDESITHADTGNIHPSNDQICNRAGISWNDDNHSGETFDATAALKHRSCFLKRMGNPALKGMTKIKLADNTFAFQYNGKKIEVSAKVDAGLTVAKQVRAYMKGNHQNPALNWGGAWGGYCKKCDESKILSNSWVASCASQDLAPTAPDVILNVFTLVGFDQ
jgi:hypothetical protein